MLKQLSFIGLTVFGWNSLAHALPSDDTFSAAGLGSSAEWSLLGPSIFGTGGNGFLADGGGALYALRLAAYDHRFGTADTSYGSLIPIFDMTDGAAVNDTAVWLPAADPFLFYFQGLCDNCLGDDGFVFSDGHTVNDPNGQLDMAIYQSNSDPSLFALFFDDGGGGGIGNDCSAVICDDDDFNDMVVTVQSLSSDVSEPGALAAFGVGLAALGLWARGRRRN